MRVILFFVLWSGFLRADEGVERPMPGRAPNVVILYGDDVGYGDVGAYGSTKIPTPRIDALAAQGLRFTDAHCASATCTPSRYALLTGEMAFRQPGTGIAHALANLLIDPERFTLADLFRQEGYRTAVIGKWHLGLDDEPIDWNGLIKPGPEALGFDRHFIIPATNDRLPCVYVEAGRVVRLDPADPITVRRGRGMPGEVPGTVYPNARHQPESVTAYPGDAAHSGTVINGIGRIGHMRGGKSALFRDEDIADDLVREAGRFIREHANRPFFLFFSANDIHAPRWPHSRFRGVSDHGLRGDAMVSFDWSVGAILDLLEEEGLTGDTLIILSSDNGPVYIDGGYLDGCEVKKSGGVDRGHRAAGPFRGGKYQAYEGGTRVPLIVRWPRRVKPGVSEALFSQVDLLASLAELLEAKIPEGEAPDSRRLLPTLLGKDEEGSEVILTHAFATRAIRRGSWKYIGGDEPGLYDLAADPGETRNLVDARSGVATEMADLLSRHAETGLGEAKNGSR